MNLSLIKALVVGDKKEVASPSSAAQMTEGGAKDRLTHAFLEFLGRKKAPPAGQAIKSTLESTLGSTLDSALKENGFNKSHVNESRTKDTSAYTTAFKVESSIPNAGEAAPCRDTGISDDRALAYQENAVSVTVPSVPIVPQGEEKAKERVGSEAQPEEAEAMGGQSKAAEFAMSGVLLPESGLSLSTLTPPMASATVTSGKALTESASTQAPSRLEPLMSEPLAQKHEPSAQKQEPLASVQEASAQMHEPSAEGQEPLAPVHEPSAEGQDPLAPVQQASMQVREPLAEEQEPSVQVREPSAEGQEPSAQVREPSAQVREPSAQVREPLASAQHASAEEQEPSASVQEASVQEKEIAAPAQQALMQEQDLSVREQQSSVPAQEQQVLVQGQDASAQEPSATNQATINQSTLNQANIDQTTAPVVQVSPADSPTITLADVPLTGPVAAAPDSHMPGPPSISQVATAGRTEAPGQSDISGHPSRLASSVETPSMASSSTLTAPPLPRASQETLVVPGEGDTPDSVAALPSPQGLLQQLAGAQAPGAPVPAMPGTDLERLQQLSSQIMAAIDRSRMHHDNRVTIRLNDRFMQGSEIQVTVKGAEKGADISVVLNPASDAVASRLQALLPDLRQALESRLTHCTVQCEMQTVDPKVIVSDERLQRDKNQHQQAGDEHNRKHQEAMNEDDDHEL